MKKSHWLFSSSLVERHLDGDGLEEFLADLDVYLGVHLGVVLLVSIQTSNDCFAVNISIRQVQ